MTELTELTTLPSRGQATPEPTLDQGYHGPLPCILSEQDVWHVFGLHGEHLGTLGPSYSAEQIEEVSALLDLLFTKPRPRPAQAQPEVRDVK